MTYKVVIVILLLLSIYSRCYFVFHRRHFLASVCSRGGQFRLNLDMFISHCGDRGQGVLCTVRIVFQGGGSLIVVYLLLAT